MKTITKHDISILIGNCFEHYDTALYSILAPILAPIFFPCKNQLLSLILTYSVFVIEFITKPLGVMIFGIIANKKSPTIGLAYSLLGVAILTMLIGFLPSFSKVGLLSPILLIIIKIIRSVFISGENTISELYLLANKKSDSAFMNSIWYQSSTVLGIILASGFGSLIIYLKKDNLWRICYLFGGFSGLLGIYFRNSKNSLQIRPFYSLKTKPMSYFKLFWANRVNVIRIAIVNGFSYMTYVIPFVVMNALIPLISNITLNQMMIANTIFLLFDMLMIPLAGKFLIKFKVNKIMVYSVFIIAISILPLWYFINTSFYFVCYFRFWIVFWGIIYLCPLNLWKANLFKNAGNEKYILVGIGNTLGSIIIGKPMSPICLYLYYLLKHHIYIGFYILFICIITFICIIYKK